MTKTNEQRFASLRKLFQFGTRHIEVQAPEKPHRIRHAVKLLLTDGFDSAYEVDLTYELAKKLRDQLDVKLSRFETERNMSINRLAPKFSDALKNVCGGDAGKLAQIHDNEEIAQVVRMVAEEFPSSELPDLGVWLTIYFPQQAEGVRFGYRSMGMDIT